MVLIFAMLDGFLEMQVYFMMQFLKIIGFGSEAERFARAHLLTKAVWKCQTLRLMLFYLKLWIL